MSLQEANPSFPDLSGMSAEDQAAIKLLLSDDANEPLGPGMSLNVGHGDALDGMGRGGLWNANSGPLRPIPPPPQLGKSNSFDMTVGREANPFIDPEPSTTARLGDRVDRPMSIDTGVKANELKAGAAEGEGRGQEEGPEGGGGNEEDDGEGPWLVWAADNCYDLPVELVLTFQDEYEVSDPCNHEPY